MFFCDNEKCVFHIEMPVSGPHRLAIKINGARVETARHKYIFSDSTEYFLCDSCRNVIEMLLPR